MPNEHFAKNLADIFNNPNLGDNAKYDLCCKKQQNHIKEL